MDGWFKGRKGERSEVYCTEGEEGGGGGVGEGNGVSGVWCKHLRYNRLPKPQDRCFWKSYVTPHLAPLWLHKSKRSALKLIIKIILFPSPSLLSFNTRECSTGLCRGMFQAAPLCPLQMLCIRFGKPSLNLITQRLYLCLRRRPGTYLFCLAIDAWLKPEGTSKWKTTTSGRKLLLKQVQKTEKLCGTTAGAQRCQHVFLTGSPPAADRRIFTGIKIHLFWMIEAVHPIVTLVLPVFSRSAQKSP